MEKKVVKKAVKSTKMFKNVKELKDFIMWAKQEKISSFNVSESGEIGVAFSPLAYVAPDYDVPEPEATDSDIGATDLNEVDDDLLYHST